MKSSSLFAILILFAVSFCDTSQSQDPQDAYTLVVYNVENLFDADGFAVFDDYKPDVYSPRNIFTKIDNMARLMARYNNGAGPDVLVLSEMESDYSQPTGGNNYGVQEFLQTYSDVSLAHMLGDGFNDAVADLPSELLLLKGLADRGLTGYDVAVAYDPLENGRPTHVQKNVILSRLPIQHSRTRAHTIEDARPILEVWLDVDGHDLAVFANHWKSRASDAEIEKVRVQNAGVLRARLDELRAENPRVDFILGGDFNSDYNQSYRYSYMEKTGVNDVLRSTGNEAVVAAGHPEKIYNLWHEVPVDQRGSDTFRGFWGTLMQIMISPGLYDYNGVQYVDNSFEVGRFPGKNVYPNSLTPIRWNSFGDGMGYSDHLPISMQFKVVKENDTSKTMTLSNPSVTDNEHWSPIAVSTRMPMEGEYFDATQLSGSLRSQDYFDQLFLVQATLNNRLQVTVNGENYDLYAPGFNVRNQFASNVGQTIRFYGRLGTFRGNWQFVIESPDYVLGFE